MNRAAMDISALSKDAFHLASVINQRATLFIYIYVTQEVTADHPKTRKIKYSSLCLLMR